MTAKIYYDGECPFCSRYVTLVRLRHTVGDVKLINLRDVPAKRDALSAEGFDLDQGMVVDIDGRRVGGGEAVNLLAGMSTSSDLFNRLNRAIFGNRYLSGLIYPVLRTGRWLTLFLMGRRVINDGDPSSEQRQLLFGALFALFSLSHVFNNLFEYGSGFAQYDIWMIFAAALFLLLRPASPQRLFWLMLISSASTIIQAPVQSNHTMLRTMLLIGYWLSFAYAGIRARPIGEIFGNVALSGRGALLVMYFYGIFHKINTGFLDPEVSCAVALWNEMLPPLNMMQGEFVHYASIYGTFVIEGLLIGALLFRRTRHVGMVGGIAFHMLLTFSNFAAYISFTTLALSLHVLFLNGVQLDRINRSEQMRWVALNAQRRIYRLVFLILIAVGAFYMLLGSYNIASLCLLPIVLVVCSMIIKQGAYRDNDELEPYSYASYCIGALVTVLYFANGSAPYLGLKTAQSVAMFSNLHLEGGRSNHLVFSNPQRPLRYLQQVAVIDDAHGDRRLSGYKDNHYAIIYYDLLSHLERNRDTVVSFTMDGQRYSDVGYRELENEIDSTLHSRFVRKWLHFRPVDIADTQRCF